MIKNANIYCIKTDMPLSVGQVLEAFNGQQFLPCAPTQALSAGWAPPRSEGHELIEVFGNHLLLKFVIETKVVPPAILASRVDEMAKAVETETGRKPGRKQRKELKEMAIQELLVHAFPRRSSHWVWLDIGASRLVVDASSIGKADGAVTGLVQAIDGLMVLPLETVNSPANAMTDWLMAGEASPGLTIDRELDLKATDESKAVVRYRHHPLDIEEIRDHIRQSKLPTQLAITYDSRVSMVLTDQGQLKRIELLDVVFESAKPDDDAFAIFDSDVAITTGELSKLIDDLIEALGGLLQRDSGMLG
ncbi:MAG: recombination-associated protein RdgC [Burkholderiales bacterium]